MGGALRRPEGQRLRAGRVDREGHLGAQGRRSSLRGDHRLADLLRRSRVRARARSQRRGARWTAGVRMLHLPRKCVGTRCWHRSPGVEDLHGRRETAARHQRARQTTVGTCRRRNLVCPDHRSAARRRVCEHWQWLRRSAAADDRRRSCAGSPEWESAMGAPVAGERLLDARLPRDEHRQSELPACARARLRLRRVAGAGDGRWARSPGAAAEIRDDLRPRSG